MEKELTKEQQEEHIQAGEYCGICGETAKTQEAYEIAKEELWYCSPEHQREGLEYQKRAGYKNTINPF